MPGSSAYPSAFDSFATTHQDNVGEAISAAFVNELADACNKIERELGVNPSAAQATVAARIGAVEAAVGGGQKGVIDFLSEYGGVRGTATGGEASNATAFSNLATDIRNHTTRDGIRVIDFGPSDGTAYWLSGTVDLHDFESVVFLFRTGPTFNESIGGGRGTYFMWNGAANTPMFSMNVTGAYTTQQGLHWIGCWNMLTNVNDRGYGLYIDGVNNWGGPYSALGFGSQGATKYLQRGIVTDRTVSDNAHGGIGAIYSAGCTQAAIYCVKGGFYVPLGNISVASGQKGAFVGADATEMKFGPGLKFDGSGTHAIDLQGGMSIVEGCNFEGFDSGVAIDIHRTANTNYSGRYNSIVHTKHAGSSGGQIAWKCRHDGGIGSAFANVLDMPVYSNTANMAKTNDATLLPNGVGVFDAGHDAYRLIVAGAYV